MLRRILLFAGAAVSPASGAWAQSSPPPAPQPPSQPAAGPDGDEQEILVVADPTQRSSIDRETYTVRDTAEARTSSALDLLTRIPSVTVQPDNSIRLLGRTGVTILVDGRPSPNPNVLRDLQGSDIARIEVISNPSAQFSSSGTGGVINIVTRHNFLNGLRGSVTASVSRYGGFELRASPSWTQGDWTISGNLNRSRYESVFGSTRERLGVDAGGVALDSIEDRHSRSRSDSLGGNVQVSYRPTEKQTITLQGGIFGGDGRTSGNSVIVRAADPDAPLSQLTAGNFDYRAYNGSLEYRRQGNRQGEMLTTSIQQYRFAVDSSNDILTDFGAGTGLFRFRSDTITRARIFKLDYVRPLRGGQRLLLGGSANDTRSVNLLEQGGDLPLGGNPFPPASRIDGSRLEMAAYATYQFPLLGGTVMPGLRIEGRNYHFADESLGEGPSDAHFFPSLHLERPVAGWLTANLSYSRRIAWPEIPDLSPALRFSDSTSAVVGNPALRPELTDSYEAKLRAEAARQTFMLTLFARRTDNLFSSLATLTDDGVLVTQRINLGVRDDRGASLAIQGPIVRGLSYSLNANLADRRIRQQGFDLRRVRARANYDATAQIDYRDGSEGRRGADRVNLTARYSGPYDDGLRRTSDFFLASASWSHAFTDRLSGVVTVDSLFGATTFRSISFSDTVVSRETSRLAGPRIKLALTYSLGVPGRPAAPAPPPPPLPGPGAQ